MFYRSLVGLSVAGCLLSIAFAGGAAAVAYYVFSKPPRIAAHAPLSDTLARMLRARGALVAGDVASYAYQPAGQEDSTLLLLTRHRTVVVTPHQVRSYARDSVRRDINLEIHGGLSFRLVIYAPRKPPRTRSPNRRRHRSRRRPARRSRSPSSRTRAVSSSSTSATTGRRRDRADRGSCRHEAPRGRTACCAPPPPLYHAFQTSAAHAPADGNAPSPLGTTAPGFAR